MQPFGQGQSPPAGFWQLAVLDDPDQADALGYHDLTNEGLPLGKIFVKADLQAGASWTVTLSHETLEMLADPDINLTTLVDQNQRRGWLYAYEVCDACESDQYGYAIDGVKLSDFVFPAWFETFWSPNATQFDQMRKVAQPLELLAGGYISVLRVAHPAGWQEITAEGERYRNRAPVGSRRERRKTRREHWRRSQHTWGN